MLGIRAASVFELKSKFKKVTKQNNKEVEIYLDPIDKLYNVRDVDSFENELNVLRECLDPVEGGDERDRDAAIAVHLTPQKDVLGQILRDEVVLAGTGKQLNIIIHSPICRLMIQHI